MTSFFEQVSDTEHNYCKKIKHLFQKIKTQLLKGQNNIAINSFCAGYIFKQQ